MIVGYSTTTTIGEGGFTQIAPYFTKVDDGTKLSLSDLSFTPERGDNIQLFDENGDNSEILSYERKGNKTTGYTYYWENMNGEEVSDYDFPRGSSIWINTASQIDLTQSGAVSKSATVVSIPGNGGFAQTGNNTPVPLKLSALVFDNIARGDNIQLFDENGDNSEVLSYERKGNKTTGYTYYWENMNGEEVDPEAFTFAPGQVFWINCADEGTLTIPAPTL